MATSVTGLKCPACGGSIREPFSRFSGPVAFVRRPHRRGCRLIVTPDPVGHDHSVHQVHGGTSLEQALAEAIRDHQEAA